MRNKKGFTLAELLAAIIVFGILSGVAITSINRMLKTNRDRIYISDAKKLVTYAEYQMRANNTSLKKPKNGNCIIVSLGYFQNSDFSTGPNGGEYSLDASYVKIKNNEEVIEYTVSLIEKLKRGGYKGIYNAESSELYDTTKAKGHIKSFSANDIETIANTTIDETCIKYS